jgi:hypothetical protein
VYSTSRKPAEHPAGTPIVDVEQSPCHSLHSRAGADKFRPAEVVEAVKDRTAFQFNMSHFVAGWKKTGCRPATNAPNPERTIAKYCVYDEPHRDYVYRQAFVEKLAREASTEDGFRAFYGKPPVRKSRKQST